MNRLNSLLACLVTIHSILQPSLGFLLARRFQRYSFRTTRRSRKYSLDFIETKETSCPALCSDPGHPVLVDMLRRLLSALPLFLLHTESV
jgi:hypothetical protein